MKPRKLVRDQHRDFGNFYTSNNAELQFVPLIIKKSQSNDWDFYFYFNSLKNSNNTKSFTFSGVKISKILGRLFWFINALYWCANESSS